MNTYRIQTIIRPIRSLVIDTAKIGIVFSLFTLISVGFPLSLVAADTNNKRPALAQTETTKQPKAEPAQASQESNGTGDGTQANSNTDDTKTTKQPNTGLKSHHHRSFENKLQPKLIEKVQIGHPRTASFNSTQSHNFRAININRVQQGCGSKIRDNFRYREGRYGGVLESPMKKTRDTFHQTHR